MKILMFSRLFYPHVGGVEEHVEKLSEQLINKGHKVTIITEQYNNKLKLSEKCKSAQIFRIPIPHQKKQKKWHIWKWLWENRALIRAADLIHIHDVFFWFLPFKLIFPRKKIYITFHGYEGSTPPKIKAIIQRKIGEWLSRGSICVGEFMKKWYQAKPDFVIYGATDRIKSLKPTPRSVIYLGRLSEDTGIMTYLQAIKILKDKQMSIKLDVYGKGPQLNQAKTFVKENRLDVKFHGFVKNAQRKIPRYSLAFISRYLGILEAMMAKRPVFAVYNNQIKKDYLTCHPQAKNMVIANHGRMLADKIIKYLNHPQSFQVKVNQAYRFAEKQTWNKLTEKYLQLWQK